MTLEEVLQEHVRRTLEACNGNISEAARELGIHRSSLQRMLRRHAVPKTEAQPVCYSPVSAVSAAGVTATSRRSASDRASTNFLTLPSR